MKTQALVLLALATASEAASVQQCVVSLQGAVDVG